MTSLNYHAYNHGKPPGPHLAPQHTARQLSLRLSVVHEPGKEELRGKLESSRLLGVWARIVLHFWSLVWVCWEKAEVHKFEFYTWIE